MTYYLGVDGGGTKTECILVDESGAVRARHLAAGTNPSSIGAEAGRLLAAALRQLRVDAGMHLEPPVATVLCMAGSLDYWTEIAQSLEDCGDVTVFDDSLPVLELATNGAAGMVLHAGTGSFVAARDRSGRAHYAGGLGWRFGDQGSGYDLGRRAVTRVLLERQGWAEPSQLGALIAKEVGKEQYAELTRLFYGDPNATRLIAGLAPVVLHAVEQGDAVAAQLARASAIDFLDFGIEIANQLFGAEALAGLSVGVSGRILNHAAILGVLNHRAPFKLLPITGAPSEGVRRMLVRLARGTA